MWRVLFTNVYNIFFWDWPLGLEGHSLPLPKTWQVAQGGMAFVRAMVALASFPASITGFCHIFAFDMEQ